MATEKRVKTVGGKDYDEEGLIAATIRRLRHLYYGERAYLPGHKKRIPRLTPKVAKPKQKAKEKKTARTVQIVNELGQAGLTKEEIERLQGKKK